MYTSLQSTHYYFIWRQICVQLCMCQNGGLSRHQALIVSVVIPSPSRDSSFFNELITFSVQALELAAPLYHIIQFADPSSLIEEVLYNRVKLRDPSNNPFWKRGEQSLVFKLLRFIANICRYTAIYIFVHFSK